MKKSLILLGAVITLGFATKAQAISFDFSGSDEGGTGSATMTFDDTQFGTMQLTISVDNTSPTTLDSGSGGNAPGVTAFGFDAADPVPTLTSWTLEAFNNQG